MRTISVGTIAAVAAAMCVSIAPLAQAATSASPGSYQSVANTRVLDTRSGIGAPIGKVPANGTVTFNAAPGLPAAASALVLHVTAVNPTSKGYLTVFGAGTARPVVSNVNFEVGETVPNMVVVQVAAGDRVSIFNGSPGTVDLLADVSGYFAGGTAANNGNFVPLAAPVRLLDTRIGLGAGRGKVAPQSTTGLRVGGVAGIPATASAVVVNLIATGGNSPGYLTIFQGSAPRPDTSTLNYYPRENRTNLSLIKLGPDGSVLIYNGSPGSVDIVADVTGYFLGGDPQTDGAFVSSSPFRLLDTRVRGGIPFPALVTGRVQIFPVTPGAPNPFTIFKAVVVNVTAAEPAGAGYLTTWDGASGIPSVSSSNFVRGRDTAGSVIVPVADDGTISIYNGSYGTVNIVVDVTGFFLSPAVVPTIATATPGNKQDLARTTQARIQKALALMKTLKTAPAAVSMTRTTR